MRAALCWSSQQQESAAQYKAADRNDLAEKELKEVEFISSFLPTFMPLEQVSTRTLTFKTRDSPEF